VALISKSVKVGFFFVWFGLLLLLLLLGFFCSPSFDKDLVLVWRIRSIVFLFESCNLPGFCLNVTRDGGAGVFAIFSRWGRSSIARIACSSLARNGQRNGAVPSFATSSRHSSAYPSIAARACPFLPPLSSSLTRFFM
jgi:hypothetical protein